MSEPQTDDPQAAEAEAIFCEALADLAGKLLTPDLIETIKTRLVTRAAILPQLLEDDDV